MAFNTTIPDAEGGISGRSDPLWGATENVALSDIDITMKHVATFFKFVITAEEDITVSSIKATSPENVFIGTSVLVDLTDGGEQSQGFYERTTVTATVRNGSIAEGETGIFYFPTEAFTLASGQVLNFVLNTTDGKTLDIDITAPASGYNFEAGKVNTIARTWEAVVEDPNFTWDLSTASYSSQSATAVVWEHTVASMAIAKNKSNTASNNYLPGVGDTPRTSSRFYTNSLLTITPGAGYSIKKIEFVATTEGYATNLKNSTWTNASASVEGTLVTVTPTDGTSELSALIGGNCGFTLVKVFYETAALVPVTGVSLEYPSLRILLGASIPFKIFRKFFYRNDAEVDPRAYRKIRIYADAIMVEQDRRDRILMIILFMLEDVFRSLCIDLCAKAGQLLLIIFRYQAAQSILTHLFI